MQSRKKVQEPKKENVTLGPEVREGEHVFVVARIFASFNGTLMVSICISVYMLIACYMVVFFDEYFVFLIACDLFVRKGYSFPYHRCIFCFHLIKHTRIYQSRIEYES